MEGNAKLSSTHTSKIKANSTIYLSDTSQQIQKKIFRYAFSGGGTTLKEHRLHGGNCDVDMAYQWLRYFEEDDEVLIDIKNRYSIGELLSGEIKKILVDKVISFIDRVKIARSQITEDVVADFYNSKPLALF